MACLVWTGTVEVQKGAHGEILWRVEKLALVAQVIAVDLVMIVIGVTSLGVPISLTKEMIPDGKLF
jgi:uncharacterized membrane protein